MIKVLIFSVCMLLLFAGPVFLQAGDTEFLHIAQPANSSGNFTILDNPATNGNPNAILIVTPNWNPGGARNGVYNAHNIGVFYITSSGKWAIFNQTVSAAIPLRAAFNVMVRTPGSSAFVHQANNSNIAQNYTTLLDNPATNYHNNTIILVTPNWNPSGTGGTYNNHPTGVSYLHNTGRWAIFNQDQGAMPSNAAFNVVVMNPMVAPDHSASAFTHTTAGGDIQGNYTIINHPGSNNKGNALVFVTMNQSGAGSGELDNHPVGVFYTAGKWAVFNQDMAQMPIRTCFNVVVKWSGPD